MRRSDFICDRCGRELEHHGKRFLCRIQKVPAIRSVDTQTFDLCPTCEAWLKVELHHGKYIEVGDGR